MHLTFGAWFTYFALVLIIAIIGVFVMVNMETFIGKVGSIIVTLVLCVIALFGFEWYYTHTASGARALKTQESEFNNGIERIVTVYDVNGKVIKTYEGKFDVTYDEERILFDDEEGLRHVIYYPTGTVIIDEVK